MGVTGTIPSTVAPSSKSWLGVGRELITGLGPVLPTNTIPLDMSSYQPEDTPKFLHDDAIRGVMAMLYNDILGVEDATFSFGGPMFLDVGGFWIDNTFGDLSTTGTSAASTTTVNSGGTIGSTQVVLASGSGYSSASSVQIDTGSVVRGRGPHLPAAGGTISFTSNPLRFAHGTSGSGAAASVVVAPYTHKWAILNTGSGQPPTHTLTDYTSLTASVGARAYPSACVSQLDFTGNSEQLLMQKVSGNSWLSAAASQTPTNTTSFTIPQPNWLSTVSIGGIAVLQHRRVDDLGQADAADLLDRPERADPVHHRPRRAGDLRWPELHRRRERDPAHRHARQARRWPSRSCWTTG